MDFSLVLLISVIGGLLNMLLSATVPCLIKKSNIPLLVNIRTVFDSNRQVIITSSVLVSIIIFIALYVSSPVENTLLKSNFLASSTSSPTMGNMNGMANLKYLAQLNL